MHRPQILKRKESRSRFEPKSLCLPAYNALPLGQTGSLKLVKRRSLLRELFRLRKWLLCTEVIQTLYMANAYCLILLPQMLLSLNTDVLKCIPVEKRCVDRMCYFGSIDVMRLPREPTTEKSPVITISDVTRLTRYTKTET